MSSYHFVMAIAILADAAISSFLNFANAKQQIFFLFFFYCCWNFHQNWRRKHIFSRRAMDSETTTVQSIHQPPNLTPTPGCWNGQWEWLVKQREIGERCAYIFTETCLNITYQAVVLDGPIEFRADRAQDMEGWIYVYAVNTWCSHVFLTCYFFWHCSWTRRNPSQDPRSNCCTWSAGCVTSRQSAGLQRDEARWSLCLHYWCLVLTAKVDRQCLPDKHLVLRCQLHYNHHLVSALYIPRDANFLNVLQNNSLL